MVLYVRFLMRLTTILNRVHKIPGFLYGKIRLLENAAGVGRLEVQVRPRAGNRPLCSVCGMPGPGYDRLKPRRFQFVPVLGLQVWLVYAMRRVSCKWCSKVKVEKVPWADGKRPVTKAFAWMLAGWAKRLSWKETASAFDVSWECVHRSVAMAVRWGREHVCLKDIRVLGVDEIAWHKGHKYLTLVYQLDAGCRRLLWVGQHRKKKTLEDFFDWFGPDRSASLHVVCSDMWKPYLTVVAARASQAVRVLDRFHIMKKLSEAIDKVRAGEARQLKAQGKQPVLKNSRWLLLKWREHLSELQVPRLQALLKLNLDTVRAYLLKEEFRQFFDARSPTLANKFLKRWRRRAYRTKLQPLAKFARMLTHHRPLILNWFRTGRCHSSGAVEGLNLKAKLALRRAFGFRTYDACQLALYHTLGHLPQPPDAHKFCG